MELSYFGADFNFVYLKLLPTGLFYMIIKTGWVKHWLGWGSTDSATTYFQYTK